LEDIIYFWIVPEVTFYFWIKQLKKQKRTFVYIEVQEEAVAPYQVPNNY